MVITHFAFSFQMSMGGWAAAVAWCVALWAAVLGQRAPCYQCELYRDAHPHSRPYNSVSINTPTSLFPHPSTLSHTGTNSPTLSLFLILTVTASPTLLNYLLASFSPNFHNSQGLSTVAPTCPLCRRLPKKYRLSLQTLLSFSMTA